MPSYTSLFTNATSAHMPSLRRSATFPQLTWCSFVCITVQSIHPKSATFNTVQHLTFNTVHSYYTTPVQSNITHSIKHIPTMPHSIACIPSLQLHSNPTYSIQYNMQLQYSPACNSVYGLLVDLVPQKTNILKRGIVSF